MCTFPLFQTCVRIASEKKIHRLAEIERPKKETRSRLTHHHISAHTANHVSFFHLSQFLAAHNNNNNNNNRLINKSTQYNLLRHHHHLSVCASLITSYIKTLLNGVCKQVTSCLMIVDVLFGIINSY